MKETFQEIISYFKKPVLEKDNSTNLNFKFRKFWHILILCILTSIILTPLFMLIEHFGWVNMDDHAIKQLIDTHSKSFIFFITVVIAPLLEELIFRAPLTLFKSEKTFKAAFYIIAILFGLVHLSNYTITNNVLFLTPILIAPQTILGGYFGYIRVRFGLSWSILLHACYNAFFMLFVLFEIT